MSSVMTESQDNLSYYCDNHSSMVKYLHSSLACKSIDWDAAFLEAVPRVQASKTAENYADAVRGMLAVLDDPCCTHFVSLARPSTISSVPPSVQMRDDGIMVGSFGDPRQFGVLQQTLMQAKGASANAKAILLDMRGCPIASHALRSVPLIARPGVAPNIRQRFCSVYPAPDGSGSGGSIGRGIVEALAPGIVCVQI
jgi:hypothetical protein